MENSISYEDFVDLMLDPDTTESDIEKYVDIDIENSEAYQPRFKFKEGAIRNPRVENALILNILNSWYRRKRNDKYKRKITEGYSGKIIVSEGDSWFQYPMKLYDIIDHLSEKYAVYSLGAAGDWLKDIISENEYLKAIEKEKASVLVVSGGGNDLVGSERIKNLIRPFEAGLAPEEYTGVRFNNFINQIENQYRFLFTSVYEKFPSVKIICHGYDYSIPDSGGKWFGKPMEQIGISDRTLQQGIAKHIADRFNILMNSISQDYHTVTYINCRNIVGSNRWYDELHPNDDAFKDIADRFINVIDNEV
ncbi:SGNH/GDSL hydrolase family protein [Desulfobulbus sp. US4]|nr:SGNH/GDSL hydrolase family protein [Desulfobulbus sp. US4]